MDTTISPRDKVSFDVIPEIDMVKPHTPSGRLIDNNLDLNNKQLTIDNFIAITVEWSKIAYYYAYLTHHALLNNSAETAQLQITLRKLTENHKEYSTNELCGAFKNINPILFGFYAHVVAILVLYEKAYHLHDRIARDFENDPKYIDHFWSHFGLNKCTKVYEIIKAEIEKNSIV